MAACTHEDELALTRARRSEAPREHDPAP